MQQAKACFAGVFQVGLVVLGRFVREEYGQVVFVVLKLSWDVSRHHAFPKSRVCVLSINIFALLRLAHLPYALLSMPLSLEGL